ncbi:hypothetical protein D1007_28667 [Hordeum vulgare]|nr:hypothetical protein D1007_28667 [Hordeum vulgare]
MSRLCNLEMGKSYHRHILLDTEYLEGVAAQPSKLNCKFEARWLSKETVEEVVKTAWQKVIAQGLCPSAKNKLDTVHKDLHEWDCKLLKGPRDRLRSTHKELDILMRASFNAKTKEKHKDLSLLVENLLEQEEFFLTQRGRVN